MFSKTQAEKYMRKITPRNMRFKLLKLVMKKENLKSSQKEKSHYVQRKKYNIVTVDSMSRTVEKTRLYSNIFKIQKEKKLQSSQNTIPEKISSKIKMK